MSFNVILALFAVCLAEWNRLGKFCRGSYKGQVFRTWTRSAGDVV